jgi:hypothetical protein
MKKSIFWALTVIFLFTFTSLAFSEEEAMTPEKISGIWEGRCNVILNDMAGVWRNSCRALFTPNLNGIMSCRGQSAPFKFVFDGQGDIVNNHLIIYDREKPSVIRIEAYITSKNQLEGGIRPTGNIKTRDLLGFKKIRELTDEEKQLPLAQLEGLLK